MQAQEKQQGIEILDDEIEYLEDKILELQNSTVYEYDQYKVHNTRQEIDSLENRLDKLADFLEEFEEKQKTDEKEPPVFCYAVKVNKDLTEHFITLGKKFSEYIKHYLIDLLQLKYPLIIKLINAVNMKNKDTITFQFEESNRTINIKVSEYKSILKSI